ncbi:MAG: Smr/MutS family protein [Candidatus Binatia bacterium]
MKLWSKTPKENPIELNEEESADESPFSDPVVLPLEDVLDLHPFAPKEIRSVVEEYLLECCAAGWTTVRLIHGKGKGVQRESIRALLARLPYVQSFHDAPPEAGSWGATIVELNPALADPSRNS